MNERWLKFWASAGATGDPLPEWRSLSAHYGEPHRKYHTIGHIAHCLDELEEVRTMAGDPVAVEMALWYHDAVYDPRAHDNEARSAELARQAAAAMGLPRGFCDRVGGLILVSTHQAPASSPDAQLFADIDLAILGRPTAIFAQYERQVRAEYSWVPEREFRAARSAILQSFLDRSTIYATTHFRRKYEEPARLNLSVSLKNLR